ncbi:hypothetical protein [Jeotgalicoccus sp. WY2]|uniref:hypothetical protein n=1 Tax=Jeotgalicoccus sp. WY2 TaxID=2708346 RepID=UPI001BD3FAE5|nr:hypothetical protein [Jeotgalicoccus sp. WY2]
MNGNKDIPLKDKWVNFLHFLGIIFILGVMLAVFLILLGLVPWFLGKFAVSIEGTAMNEIAKGLYINFNMASLKVLAIIFGGAILLVGFGYPLFNFFFKVPFSTKNFIFALGTFLLITTIFIIASITNPTQFSTIVGMISVVAIAHQFKNTNKQIISKIKS